MPSDASSPPFLSRIDQTAVADCEVPFVNIAMILAMAADALGHQLAYGTRADGLTYEDLRLAARAHDSEGQ